MAVIVDFFDIPAVPAFLGCRGMSCKMSLLLLLLCIIMLSKK